jgi:drug/metabolite transporter (DMT)-like permease
MTIASLLLFLARIGRSNKLHWASIKHDLPFVIALGILFTFIPTLLKFYALRHLACSHAVFFKSFGPFITAFYAFLFFGERLSAKKILGIIIGAAAFILLFAPSAVSWQAFFSVPMIAGFAAIALIKLRWVLMQDRMKNADYEPSDLNALCFFFAGMAALLVEFCNSGVHMFDTLLTAPPITFLALTYAVLVGTILTYNFYAHCLKKYSATFMSLTQLLLPVYVAGYGYFIFGEPISASFIGAAGLMFAALYIFYSAEENVSIPEVEAQAFAEIKTISATFIVPKE